MIACWSKPRRLVLLIFNLSDGIVHQCIESFFPVTMVLPYVSGGRRTHKETGMKLFQAKWAAREHILYTDRTLIIF